MKLLGWNFYFSVSNGCAFIEDTNYLVIIIIIIITVTVIISITVIAPATTTSASVVIVVPMLSPQAGKPAANSMIITIITILSATVVGTFHAMVVVAMVLVTSAGYKVAGLGHLDIDIWGSNGRGRKSSEDDGVAHVGYSMIQSVQDIETV